MAGLAALIFDVDGTLAETEEWHREAFNESFKQAGLGWHWDQANYAALLEVTGGKERIAYHIRREGLPPMPPERIAALHQDKTARYTARVAAGGITLRPGVLRLMREARRARVKLAIATTTSRPNVMALLRAVGDVPDFDVIAAGDEVKTKKPAPDVFLAALRDLALPPEACIAFEDTLNGVKSAVGAGLRVLVTTSLYGGTGPFPGALGVVSDLGEPGAPARGIAGTTPLGGVVTLNWLRGRG